MPFLEHSREGISIDNSPTACGVMAKRLRDVCGLPESEPLWRAGRGFVVRDLPWSEEKLRAIPPFEFENWAVIALGGIPNKVQVGDLGVAASRQSAGNFDGIEMAAFCRKPLRQNGLGAP